MKLKHDIDYQEDEVDGVVYRIARTRSDINAAKDLYIDVLLAEEPATKSKGGYPDGQPSSIAEGVMKYLSDGLSLVAVDAETRRVVGMKISHVVEREHAPKTRRSLDELLSVYPETHAHLVYVLEKFTWPADIFDKHPSVNRLFDMHGLATIKSHRGRGIATQLMKKSLEVARKANCDAASEVCSNPHSKRIFDRLGFEVTAEEKWGELEMGGRVYFDQVEEPTFTVHYKKLT